MKVSCSSRRGLLDVVVEKEEEEEEELIIIKLKLRNFYRVAYLSRPTWWKKTFQ